MIVLSKSRLYFTFLPYLSGNVIKIILSITVEYRDNADK